MWTKKKQTSRLLLSVLLFFWFLPLAYTQESPPIDTEIAYARLKVIFEELTKNYQQAVLRLNDSGQAISSLKQQLSDGENEIQGLTEYVRLLKQEIEERKKSIALLQRELDESKADYQLSKQALDQSKLQIAELERLYQEVLLSLKKAQQSFEDFKVAAERQIRNLKTQRNIAVIVAVLSLIFAAAK